MNRTTGADDPEVDPHRLLVASHELAAITGDARRIVRAHWSAITHLAPALAQKGRISPNRLPADPT